MPLPRLVVFNLFIYQRILFVLRLINLSNLFTSLSFNYSFIYLLNYLLTYLLTSLFKYSFSHLFVCFFNYFSFIHLFIHLVIYLLLYSIHLFIYLLLYLLIHLNKFYQHIASIKILDALQQCVTSGTLSLVHTVDTCCNKISTTTFPFSLP